MVLIQLLALFWLKLVSHFSGHPIATFSPTVGYKWGGGWLKPQAISLQVPCEILLLLLHTLGGQGNLPARMQRQTSAD